MEVPPEERFGMVVPALWESIGRIAKAVDKKFGAEGRNLLKQVQGERGSETGEMMKSMVPGEDFKSVGTSLAGMAKVFGVEGEAEVKEDEVVFKVLRCPYGLEGTSKELCEALMTFDMRLVETVSPNVTLEIVRTVAVGDPQCEISVKPRK